MSDETRDGDDSGYVHRPGGATGTAETGAGATSTGSDESGFGRSGWVLVGVVFVATIVVPGVIYLFPAAPGNAGIPFIAAMLVLPMLPAVVLGLVAVWSMTATRKT